MHRLPPFGKETLGAKGAGPNGRVGKILIWVPTNGGPACPAMKNLPEGKGRRSAVGVPDMSALFLMAHSRPRCAKVRVERVEGRGLEDAVASGAPAIRLARRVALPGKVPRVRRLRPGAWERGASSRGNLVPDRDDKEVERGVRRSKSGPATAWIGYGELDRPIFFPRARGPTPAGRRGTKRARIDLGNY